MTQQLNLSSVAGILDVAKRHFSVLSQTDGGRSSLYMCSSNDGHLGYVTDDAIFDLDFGRVD